MYKVYVSVDPDKDFSYDNSIVGFDKNEGEITLYFENRNRITDILQEFIQTIINTINTDKSHIKDTVEKIKQDLNIISMVIKKFECFKAELDYGNQSIRIYIIDMTLHPQKLYDSKTVINMYKESDVEIIDELLIRSIDISKLNDVQDVYYDKGE